ncbi:MAG: hypothetical protein M1836_007314 [Candelina mexicana]|nr:MAG: hypothetical protein M1836_007314 [Candelina mexicana]
MVSIYREKQTDIIASNGSSRQLAFASVLPGVDLIQTTIYITREGMPVRERIDSHSGHSYVEMVSNQSSTLLKLPPELRNEVYRHVIPYELLRLGSGRLLSFELHEQGLGIRSHFSLNSLLVCHQYYLETLALLYAETTFVLAGVEQAMIFLASLPGKVLERLRRISLTYTATVPSSPFDYYSQLEDLCDIVRQTMTLQVLTFPAINDLRRNGQTTSIRQEFPDEEVQEILDSLALWLDGAPAKELRLPMAAAHATPTLVEQIRNLFWDSSFGTIPSVRVMEAGACRYSGLRSVIVLRWDNQFKSKIMATSLTRLDGTSRPSQVQRSPDIALEALRHLP